jgi:hypothetical protein
MRKVLVVRGAKVKRKSEVGGPESGDRASKSKSI